MSKPRMPYLLVDVAEVEIEPAPSSPERRRMEPVSVSLVVDGANEDAEKMFWTGMRQVLLTQLDLIERRLGISPRTAELRRRWKDAKMNGSSK